MPDRPAPPAVRRARALAACAGALLLAGCGVRLETPPPAEPVADAVEVARQDAAVDAARLATTATRAAGEDRGTAELELVTQISREHLTALGGVWRAWPGGAPTDVPTTDVPTGPPVADPGPGDVLALLTDAAGRAREDALATSDEPARAVLASVAVARDRAAVRLAAALGTEAPPTAAAPLSTDALLARGVDGPTLLVLDQARYAYETVAARSDGDRRQEAAGRADHLQQLVDAAIAAGAPDGRLAVYDLPGATGPLSPEQAAAVDAEQRLLEHWIFSLGLAGAGARPALLDAAGYAAAQVERWGGTLPALPGLTAGPPTDQG